MAAATTIASSKFSERAKAAMGFSDSENEDGEREQMASLGTDAQGPGADESGGDDSGKTDAAPESLEASEAVEDDEAGSCKFRLSRAKARNSHKSR